MFEFDPSSEKLIRLKLFKKSWLLEKVWSLGFRKLWLLLVPWLRSWIQWIHDLPVCLRMNPPWSNVITYLDCGLMGFEAKVFKIWTFFILSCSRGSRVKAWPGVENMWTVGFVAIQGHGLMLQDPVGTLNESVDEILRLNVVFWLRICNQRK